MKIKPLFVLICVPVLAQAQLQVKGIVNIESGAALPYASVLLLNSSDSSLVRGQVSRDDGSFLIDVSEERRYLVSVSAVGYYKVFTKPFDLRKSNSPFDHGIIRARLRVEKLDEVVIDADRPMFEQKIDRTVINVQTNISKAGGSALDVLQRSPGVTVDKMNGVIALAGKQGVRIMINGKVSRIPASAVAQMLDGLNAEGIDRIELITTPPSKYEAEGDAGLINVVMKKSLDIGTNGTTSLFSGYGRRGKFGGTLNLNKRTQKLNIYGDISSRDDYTRQDLNSTWAIMVDNERNKTTSLNDRLAYTGIKTASVGFDWNAGKKTSIGGLFSAFDRRWDMDALADISKTISGTPASFISMNTIEENDWLQLLGNVNVTHQFNKDHSISIDFDRIDYNSQNPTDYYQNFFDTQGNPTSSGRLTSRKDTRIDIWTSAIDFAGKINSQVTFEMGAKGSFTSLSNDIVVKTMEDSTWSFDDNLTSYADMTENIAAGYVSTTITPSDKVDIQLGLRYEHTVTNIDTRKEQNVVDRNFGKWFPSAFINNKINKNNSWVASYSRRISRPSFFQLAPFVIFNDPNNLYGGNISLLPSFTDAVKLEYRHKSILLSLQYSHDKNAITLFQPRINEDSKQVSTAQNLDYRDNFSIVLSFPVQITKWWEMQVNAVGSHSDIKVRYLDNPLSISIKNFRFNASQKFSISKTMNAELSGFYQSRQFFGVLEWAPIGAIDFGIEKKFRNSNLRLAYSDMLGQNKWDAKAHVPDENIDSSFFVDFETTIVSITYTMNFGNSKLRSKQARKTASTEEQSRLR
jgi:hypothetical protein